MEIPTSTGHAAPSMAVSGESRLEAEAAVARVLFGERTRPLPATADVVSAALALAAGRRRKVLLPVATEPAELARVRRGDEVLVSYYATGSAPEVWLLDRPVPLRGLLRQCAADARREARAAGGAEREVLLRLADRAEGARLSSDEPRARPVRRRGGVLEDPGDGTPLAFGFEAVVTPCPLGASDASSRADVHALLFDGTLWAWVRGRRIPLVRGPIMLAAQRMVTAVRALVEAAEAGRSVHVRLRAGSFHVSVRLDRRGMVTIGLGGDAGTQVTVPELAFAEAVLPILRLASDALRALVAIDRSQARNLTVQQLREEVRALRRRARQRDRTDGFVNLDPDRLRASLPARREEPTPSAPGPAPGRLRFGERWAASVDELDASSTFFCGDRLIAATPRRTIALSRDEGAVLWVREGFGGSTWMAGTTLLRLSSEGVVELCDVRDGEPFAVTRVAPRIGPALVVPVSGGGLPPMAVLAEGESRLVAVDLRDGEPRWRSSSRHGGAFRISRVGRLLLVVSGDGAVDAIDAASGEVVWRLSEGVRFCFAPAVSGEVVIVPAGEPGSRDGTLYGIDLYSGELLWRRRLDAAPSAAPVATGTMAALALGGPRRGSLAAFSPADGSLVWMVPDPGLGTGGACMTVDGALVVNAPAGRITSLELDTGQTRWHRDLGDPVADDVPRRLEPVLRGGALFVPAPSVHVLRTGDGASLGPAIPCDLVPDWVRVDERGWVFVAEESGHMAAYAPVAHLTLVR